MEVVIVLIVLFFGGAILQAILNAGTATAKTIAGKGSLKANLENQFQGMGPMRFRAERINVAGGAESDAISIEARGLFPVPEYSSGTNISFMVSLFDVTDGEPEPVLAHLEAFQESETTAFRSYQEGLPAEGGYGFGDWVRIGIIPLPIIQGPKSGLRRMQAAARVVLTDNPPSISMGFGGGDHPGVLSSNVIDFSHTFSERGYSEEADDREECRGLAIKLAMAVAMADGALDESEGVVIRDWIVRQVSPYSEDKQTVLKDAYNEAMRESYDASVAHQLSLSPIVARLNEIDSNPLKYEALELCHEVMAADGQIDSGETRVIRTVAESLGLDGGEIAAMRDKHLVAIDASGTSQASIEDTLGVDPTWDADRIKLHLRREFKKWNDRLASLPEGTEQDNAQTMIDLIGEARKKYD